MAFSWHKNTLEKNSCLFLLVIFLAINPPPVLDGYAVQEETNGKALSVSQIFPGRSQSVNLIIFDSKFNYPRNFIILVLDICFL